MYFFRILLNVAYYVAGIEFVVKVLRHFYLRPC